MIKELLAKVSAKQDLTFDEAKQAIDEIMSGEVSEAVIFATYKHLKKCTLKASLKTDLE